MKIKGLIFSILCFVLLTGCQQRVESEREQSTHASSQEKRTIDSNEKSEENKEDSSNSIIEDNTSSYKSDSSLKWLEGTWRFAEHPGTQKTIAYFELEQREKKSFIYRTDRQNEKILTLLNSSDTEAYIFTDSEEIRYKFIKVSPSRIKFIQGKQQGLIGFYDKN